MPPDQSPLMRLMPVLLLAVAALLMVGAWLIFPRIQAWMAYQDCVALGRTAC